MAKRPPSKQKRSGRSPAPKDISDRDMVKIQDHVIEEMEKRSKAAAAVHSKRVAEMKEEVDIATQSAVMQHAEMLRQDAVIEDVIGELDKILDRLTAAIEQYSA